MRKTLGVALAATALALSIAAATAAEFKILLMDTVETVITAQKGKKVTLRLRSGQEITGTVVLATPKVVHVSSVAGREFFDAVIPMEAIDAVLVRVKD
jgi:ABC-type polysaccharide/polyol phosphate transport system ATPase subunit